VNVARRRGICLCMALGLGLALMACSDDQAAAPAPTPRGPGGAGPGLGPTAESAEVVTEVAFRYDPNGKRDPFRSFVRNLEDDPGGGEQTPLERFDLTQLTVTAIMWGGENEPRALIRDPAGKGYIVVVGTVVGKNKGRIIEIEDNLVKVKETYVDALNRAATKNVEMRLRESQGG